MNKIKHKKRKISEIYYSLSLAPAMLINSDDPVTLFLFSLQDTNTLFLSPSYNRLPKTPFFNLYSIAQLLSRNHF